MAAELPKGLKELLNSLPDYETTVGREGRGAAQRGAWQPGGQGGAGRGGAGGTAGGAAKLLVVGVEIGGG